MMLCPGTDRECFNEACRRNGCFGRWPSPPVSAMAVHLVVCPTCTGSGTVAHTKRTLGTDEHGVSIIDPHDHQTVELCDKCGGSGKAVAPPP